MVKRYREDESKQLAELLRNGEVLAVPTDTVYGLCATVALQSAKEKLIEVKHRPANKAFPVMCLDAECVKEVAEVSLMAERIMHAFMPGPLTVILRKKDTLGAWVSDKETLAVRTATSKALYDLITELGNPIFMTSANLSGEKVCTNLDEIEESCKGIGGMMEGCPSFGKASTIVDCTGEAPVIVREGPISFEEIMAAIKEK